MPMPEKALVRQLKGSFYHFPIMFYLSYFRHSHWVSTCNYIVMWIEFVILSCRLYECSILIRFWLNVFRFWLELVDKMPDNPKRLVFESTQQQSVHVFFILVAFFMCCTCFSLYDDANVIIAHLGMRSLCDKTRGYPPLLVQPLHRLHQIEVQRGMAVL